MGKIVVGVDGSDESKEALHWAVQETRLRGSVSRQCAHHADCPVVTLRHRAPTPATGEA